MKSNIAKSILAFTIIFILSGCQEKNEYFTSGEQIAIELQDVINSNNIRYIRIDSYEQHGGPYERATSDFEFTGGGIIRVNDHWYNLNYMVGSEIGEEYIGGDMRTVLKLYFSY